MTSITALCRIIHFHFRLAEYLARRWSATRIHLNPGDCIGAALYPTSGLEKRQGLVDYETARSDVTPEGEAAEAAIRICTILVAPRTKTRTMTTRSLQRHNDFVARNGNAECVGHRSRDS